MQGREEFFPRETTAVLQSSPGRLQQLHVFTSKKQPAGPVPSWPNRPATYRGGRRVSRDTRAQEDLQALSKALAPSSPPPPPPPPTSVIARQDLRALRAAQRRARAAAAAAHGKHEAAASSDEDRSDSLARVAHGAQRLESADPLWSVFL